MFLIEGATVMTGECIRMDCGQHLGETSPAGIPNMRMGGLARASLPSAAPFAS
jgi:hypothetical protein